MTQELKTLLENPEYSRRARETGGRVQAEKGTGTAADAIEEILAS